MADHRTIAIACLFISGCVTAPVEAPPVEGPSMDTILADTEIVAVDFAPDSRYLAHLDTRGDVHLWNVLLDKSAGTLESGASKATALAMGESGLLAIANRAMIRVSRLEAGMVVEFPAPPDPVVFMRFDENSSSLAVGDESGKVTVFDLATGDPTRAYQVSEGGEDWVIQPGAGFGVMYLRGDGSMRVVSCVEGGYDYEIDVPRNVRSPVTIADDGGHIAVVSPSGRVEVRTVPDGEISATLDRIPQVPEAMDLTPDGSILAVAVRGGGVTLWDTATKEKLDAYDSEVWGASGLAFSGHGHFLCWAENDHKTVRFWSPVRGLVQWSGGSPELKAGASEVCTDSASVVRYRLASKSYERGIEELRQRRLEDALGSFETTQGVFSAYPGLRVAVAEAKERLEAKTLGDRLLRLELEGEFIQALGLLDPFLRDFAKFDDYGFKSKAATLRQMLKHFRAAEEYRKSSRGVEAVGEFQAAVEVLPELAQHHPEYRTLRQTLVQELTEEGVRVFGENDFERVVAIYADLLRLRDLTNQSLLRLGAAQENLGNAPEAERVYLSVAPDTPEFVPAQQSVARLALSAENVSKAQIHLDLARRAAPDRVELEKDFARICELNKDYDAAVSVWEEVSQLEPASSQPFEAIAKIERVRGRWNKAALALRNAITRSNQRRPDLLIEMAEVYELAGLRSEMLVVCLELLEIIGKEPQALASLGETPAREVTDWIRRAGFTQHRGEWIRREQFLEEQGWERAEEEWLRPHEARLREIAARYRDVPQGELRAFSAERYRAHSDEHRITKGMNRAEVIASWGFYRDLSVFADGEKNSQFELMIFEHTRKVYLKDGLVCHWSE